MSETFLEPEECCYPRGGYLRKGRAVLVSNIHNPIELPYGGVRSVRAALPDTWFSIKARIYYKGARIDGFLIRENGEYEFHPEADPEHCRVCNPGQGCKYVPSLSPLDDELKRVVQCAGRAYRGSRKKRRGYE